MKRYLELLREIRDYGVRQPNRTGIDAISIPGAMMKYDLREGFPAVTSKRLAFNVMKGELIGFIRGYDNARQFRDLGCKIWDANANENKEWLENPNRSGQGDLGRIYGVQWVRWRDSSGGEPLNQLLIAVRTILDNPTSRRIIISAWRPDEFDSMALPPCHVLYQFIPDAQNKVLHLCMYQRSCDMFLGVPFNIASASLLLSLVAEITGYTPGVFTHFLADAHIYVNHLDQVNEILARPTHPLPKLVLASHFKGAAINLHDTEIVDLLNSISPEHIDLENYVHGGVINAPMAV